METIDVTLGDFTLRCRSLLLSHVASGLRRGLEPGEQVILRDRIRGHFAARVADLDFTPTDTVYRLALGVRLTEQEAHERTLGRRAPVGPRRVGRQEVLDLLGELRSGVGAVSTGARRRGTGL